MRIFCDFHHAGMARGIANLFDRLGHTVYFPDKSFSAWAREVHSDPGVWHEDVYRKTQEIGGFAPGLIGKFGGYLHLCSGKQFMNTHWDIVIISRTESQQLLLSLVGTLDHKPKLIACNGNEGGGFNHARIPNLMSSDLQTYLHAPEYVHKIHYSQELGRQYFRPFQPIEQKNLKMIACYMNFLPNYDETQGNIYALWNECKALCRGVAWFSFGKGCRHPSLKEADDLPCVMHQMALTWHMKHVEGYGMSVLQSVAMGRLAIVPRGFFESRTAGKYLIDELTCFECDRDAEEIAERVNWYVSDLARANHYARVCYDKAKQLFDWEGEAERVGEWLEELL